jgi:hypothetical protein
MRVKQEKEGRKKYGKGETECVKEDEPKRRRGEGRAKAEGDVSCTSTVDT